METETCEQWYWRRMMSDTLDTVCREAAFRSNELLMILMGDVLPGCIKASVRNLKVTSYKSFFSPPHEATANYGWNLKNDEKGVFYLYPLPGSDNDLFD